MGGQDPISTSQPRNRATATRDKRYVSLQACGLLEALYDSPFYWMVADRAYRATASAHRGAFTERFAAERLASVFIAGNVHRGVTVSRGSRTVTDIDVLVTFADRAVVLQCESKRLTLEARRGNDLQLRDDFKKSVEDAYDQALASADALREAGLRFELADGTELRIATPRTIYPVCVVADHYPALTVQTRRFLKPRTDEVIRPPLPTDVFMVDVLAEMLDISLRFLSFLDRRVKPSEGSIERAETTAFVPQLFDASFDYIALDMVVMGRARHVRLPAQPSRRDETAVLVTMDRFGIADVAARRFGELSGGQRQLVILARALVGEPAILLLNEPTSASDLAK